MSNSYPPPPPTHGTIPRPGGEVIAEGRYVRLRRLGRWEYAERVTCSGIVLLVPITDAGEVILNEQFRVPVGRPVIELPAGLVGDLPEEAHESLEAAARRELLEETGYEAAELIEVAEGPPSAGITNEIISVYLARGLTRRHAGGGDATEGIVVHRVPLTGLDAFLADQQAAGRLIDPKVFLGLYFVDRR